MLAQQALQPKLSRRRYDEFWETLQKRMVFERAQNWGSIRSSTDFI